MHKYVLSIILAFTSALALANGIDDNCPTLTYKSAPVVEADQFICNQQYALLYRYETKTSIYVTQYLTTNNLGTHERKNRFKPDPSIPEQYSARLSDYRNSKCSGERCDRGHLAAAQDFTACESCLAESFYFTNIVPQHFQNNEIIWKYLENKARTYAETKNSVYIITGPVYTRRPYVIIGSGVAVPDSMFKVIIDAVTGKSIAFMMENANFPVGSLNGKVVSINAIEQATGIVFDASLEKTKSSSYQEWFSASK